MSASRRSVLKIGLVGSAVVAVGGAGLALRPTHLLAPGAPLRCLTDKQFSVLAAVADALLPERDGWPRPGEIGIAEEVDATLACCHPGVRKEMGQVLGLIENALVGLLVDRRFTTFTGSSRERQRRILEGWRHSRSATLKACFLAVHGFVVAAYFNRPEIHALIGYPGVPSWITDIRLAE